MIDSTITAAPIAMARTRVRVGMPVTGSSPIDAVSIPVTSKRVSYELQYVLSSGQSEICAFDPLTSQNREER
ncbi:hypothetical protein QN345_10110 [Cryobacterium sp. 10I1]|uniref:hypothetical protein n=1 Tax=unclassified Cryobacterium TaxID=2649013 RepID=UPI002AB39AF6|nr:MULTISPECIES: hypothetical protein [unclassified Cryobacterium]MEB0267442.1 hypothetical protein [Cryobacterium sp. 10I5]MEB0305657.1 hypothetical protein [Cryobacterium sp. 10I1]MDY7540845.1 hypothetical protein [Cryobacterium sp. 5B3]MEB0276562.1 hypothetical protein [Cryobacterium sp. 5B3]MEB0288662.1 hypothetical protein [Cryobacterium sp. 10S3]